MRTKSQVTNRIVVVEFIGFALVTAWVWADELFDLPNLIFGAQPKPANIIEAVYESTVFLVLGTIVILFTRRTLRRMKYLEGFLPVCSFCKQIRVGEQWLPVETYLSQYSEAVFSHSFCPSCTEQHYGKQFAPVTSGPANAGLTTGSPERKV